MKKVFYALTIFFFLFFAFQLKASLHEHSIEGIVKDAATGQPLAGATVVLEPTGQGRVTDYQGHFSFSILPAGHYQLRVQSLGFRSDTIRFDLSAGENKQVSFKLASAPVELGQVEIVAGHENDFSAVSGLDIALRPVLSSQEVLRQVPGLFIGQHAGGGKAEQIFLRGYDLDHGTDIAIGVDGMPVNMVSHAHGQGYADLHFLIPELIKQVQFGKGPYSTAQGNLATAGYVQFRTQNELKQNLIKTELGSFGTIRNLAMINLGGARMKAANQSFYLAAEQLASRGYFESPQDFSRVNLFTKYRAHLGHHNMFTASASTFSSTWLASGQIPDRAVSSGLISRLGAIDDNEGGNTSRSNVNLELQTFTPEGGILCNQVYFSHYQFDLFSNFTFFLNDSLNGDQIRQHEKRNLFGYRGSYTRTFNLLGRNFVTQAGADLRADFIHDIELAHTLARHITLESLQHGDVREWNADAYLDGQWELANKINLGLGLRYDQMSFDYHDRNEILHQPEAVTKGTLNPKLRLQYSPGSQLKLYIKSGSGFHSNDTRVVTDSLATAVLPRVWATDVGAFVKPAPGILLHVALWAMHSQTEFVYVGDEGVVEAGGRSRRIGADVSIRWQMAKWLFADVDLNWTRPRSLDVPSAESWIPLAPTFSSTGGITFNPWTKFKGNLRYRWLGDRPANEDNSLTATGYFLLDAQATYTWGLFDFSLSWMNALNTQWKETQFETTSRLRNEAAAVTEIHFTPGSPRAVRLGVAVRF